MAELDTASAWNLKVLGLWEADPMKVEVAPELLRWAVERSGYSETTLTDRFPKLGQWLRGAGRPSGR